MTALTGQSAKVKYTASAYSTSTGEAFTSLSPTTDRTEFRITDGTKRHWTKDLPPVVYVNSTAHTDFVWNPVQGKITFTGTPLTVAESAQVTADVYWVTASYLPWTRSWAAEVSNTMHDVTSFSTSATNVTWRTFQPGLQGGTVDLGRIVADQSTATPVWFDHLNTNQEVIVELVQHASGSTYKWEAYARVADDGYDVQRDGVQAESVTFQLDGPLYFASTE